MTTMDHNQDNAGRDEERFATPSDVCEVVGSLDRLARAERSCVTGAVCERVARASAVALSAGDDQALACTAGHLDRLAADDRAGAVGAMVERIARVTAPGGAERAPVLARLGVRQFRIAAGIAMAGMAVVGATWVMGPASEGPSRPSVISGDDREDGFDDALSSLDISEWDSPFGRDDRASLTAFEASVGSAVESLQDPWGDGEANWFGDGGSL